MRDAATPQITQLISLGRQKGEFLKMKKVNLEVCVCTECVMMGAMEIIDAIEGLKSLETDMTDMYKDLDIEVKTASSVCAPKKPHASPVVKINGERFEKANSAMIMGKISELAYK